MVFSKGNTAPINGSVSGISSENLLMARRMFSPQIVDSDAFLDMSPSAQNLYFHLGMRADDDGFVGNPKKVLRMIGGNDDDLKLLMAKRFILTFASGVIVIKHWRINNLVRKDWYRPTQYIEEKSKLFLKENGSYTDDSGAGIPVTVSLTSSVQVRPRRLGKVRLGKVSKILASRSDAGLITSLIDIFKEVNPTEAPKWYANTTQRSAADRLIVEYGYDKVSRAAKLLPKTNNIPYFPTITTIDQLSKKWTQLDAAFQKKKGEQISKGRGLA